MSDIHADRETLGRVIDDMFEALGVTDNESALVEIDRLKAIAAMPQGEPVAFLCPKCGSRGETDGSQSTVRAPAQPVAEAGVREALIRAKADLEASRTLAREVLGEPHGINQTLQMIDAALLSTTPSDGEIRNAVTRYHEALDRRENAYSACFKAMNEIMAALNMPWTPPPPIEVLERAEVKP